MLSMRWTTAIIVLAVTASALSLASFSSEPLPPLATCVRDQDAALVATAHRMSPAAVVILLTQNYCASFWWIVRSPVQSLSEYVLAYVPGRAAEPALGDKIVIQGQHMNHALASAARDILDVPDVIAVAKTFDNQGPVFVMAPRRLTVQADAVLQMIDANDSYALWQIFASGRDQTAFQPVR